MFDLGWGEMAVIGVVALIALGPKELPNALRTMSGLMRTARKLAGEFQSGLNEIVREAELEDARQKLQDISKTSVQNEIEKIVDPEGAIKKSLTPDIPEENALSVPYTSPTATDAAESPISHAGSDQVEAGKDV